MGAKGLWRNVYAAETPKQECKESSVACFGSYLEYDKVEESWNGSWR